MKLYFALLTALLSTVLKTNVEANLLVNKFKCYDQDGLNGRSFETLASITDTGLVTPGDFKGYVSSCIVNGVWLIYDGLGYAGNVNAINGLNTTYYPLSHKIKSVFWIGDSNTEDQVLLYGRPNFQGPGQPFSKTTLNVSRATPVESLILLGKTPFTIISECESMCFEECHFCVKENKDGAVFIPKLTSKSMLKILEVRKGHCNKKSLLPGRQSIRKGCDCSQIGAENVTCDKQGQCPCKKGYHGKQCKCQDGFYLVANGTCQKCGCNPKGANSTKCDDQGQCPCKPNYIGEKCYDVKDCGCSKIGSVSTKCNGQGGCTCIRYYKGALCDQARDVQISFGNMKRGQWKFFDIICHGTCAFNYMWVNVTTGRLVLYVSKNYFNLKTNHPCPCICEVTIGSNLEYCNISRPVTTNRVSIFMVARQATTGAIMQYKFDNFWKYGST